ncbi:MAG: NUDIX domain-containing protein [Gemmobacter sp.]|uniref:NUDIX hydrolase n=1 Tax=Gemmobacter sp. TaxID=1898957 RepID=UPI001A3E5344|nr:NUDIX domain-containing protein [Gemmobacter sp.]MBL8562490.1 NUDIX domain-containing protein [Gemmobacter sp.]
MTAELPIRDAATLILSRTGPEGPEVLMGQRGAGAAFMPSKYVFPGGAVDAGDAGVPLARALPGPCAARLAGATVAPATLAAAAIREVFEETGLALGRPGAWPGTGPGTGPDTGPGAVPEGWQGFAARGLVPDAGALRLVFRAITPPGRARRFDARFFLADASAIAGDAEDFSGAEDELSHLHWVSLRAVRLLDLPFITEVVLSEVALILAGGEQPGVPFFDNSGPRPTFRRLAA